MSLVSVSVFPASSVTSRCTDIVVLLSFVPVPSGYRRGFFPYSESEWLSSFIMCLYDTLLARFPEHSLLTSP